MGIGVGIFFIAGGLILALAVDYEASGVDIATVGWILVAAGVLGIILDLIIFAPRRRGVTTTSAAGEPRTSTVVEERRTYE
ncbi:MAG: DUF6458 family protein [Sporichthyaceae bacterium]